MSTPPLTGSPVAFTFSAGWTLVVSPPLGAGLVESLGAGLVDESVPVDDGAVDVGPVGLAGGPVVAPDEEELVHALRERAVAIAATDSRLTVKWRTKVSSVVEDGNKVSELYVTKVTVVRLEAVTTSHIDFGTVAADRIEAPACELPNRPDHRPDVLWPPRGHDLCCLS